MNTAGSRIMLAAAALVWLAAPAPFMAQSKVPSSHKPTKFIFLLPDGFKGWLCVDFGIEGAAPLPREGDALVIRPRRGEVLATSDKADNVFLYGKAWFEDHGHRKPLPNDVTVHSGPSRTGEAEPSERRCAFVGTTDERDAAEEAPGFEDRLHRSARIPSEERRALESLYRATDGDHWKHRVGWLGPSGSECNWHGVECQGSFEGQANVIGLELFENNLNGRIPDEITKLAHLESLTVFGNQLSGRLPDALVERWLAGSLWITAEAPLLTDVSVIDYEADAPALLCGQHRMVFRADASAVNYTRRCRKATPTDRTTYCEVKEGRVWWQDFAKLAWMLEKNGFFGLEAKYARSMTHGTFVSTRVVRLGKSYEVVDYADGAPLSLWAIQRSIEGVGSSVDWETTGTQPACPAWNQSQIHPEK